MQKKLPSNVCFSRNLGIQALLKTIGFKLNALLLTMILLSSAAYADGVGYNNTFPGQIFSDRGFRRTTEASIQRTYVYIKSGEQLRLLIKRVNRSPASTDGTPSNLQVRIYSPTGLHQTLSVDTDISLSDSYNHAISNITNQGIWTIEMDGVNKRTFWGYDLTARTPGDLRIDGRVFTETLLISQSGVSSSTLDQFSLYHLNQLGHQFQSEWYDFQGIDSRIVTDIFGSVVNNICAPSYKSTENGSGFVDCGRSFKQFFTQPNSDLPATAARFDLNTNTVITGGDWLKPLLGSTPSIGTVNWVPAPTGLAPLKGTFNFTIGNHLDNARLLVDVNNNGSFTDPIDRNIPFVANTTNNIAFDGINGLGQPIACGQTIKAKVLIERSGEIHFLLNDVEGFGGLKVTRQNGPGSPAYTLYWDDSDLADRPAGYNTPVKNGTTGVNSNVTKGVHGWALDPTPPHTRSWGNERNIDNWTYTPVNVAREITVLSPACLTLSGTVFNDGNGDAVVNGTGVSAVDGKTLYASLLDENGIVIKSIAASTAGSYSFDGIPKPGSAMNYSIVLSTTQGIRGNEAPATTLPNANWYHTGEHLGTENTIDKGNDAVVNGIIPVILTGSSTNITNLDFGIQKTPTADHKFYDFCTIGIHPTSGQDIALNGSYLPSDPSILSRLTGTDYEDSPSAAGFPVTIRITSLPAGIEGPTSKGPTLYYDSNDNGILDSGEELVPNQLINNYDPKKLHIIITKMGSTSIDGFTYTGFAFTYKTIDAAGSESDEATYGAIWCSPLPVTLVSFSLSKELNTTQVNWSTTEESNSDRFEIQRSGNTKDWVAIGTVTSARESKERRNYYFTDIAPLSATNYYRLKMIDQDQTYTFSRIQSISFDQIVKKITIYPNPAVDQFFVHDTNGDPLTPENVKEILIVNAKGIVVYQSAITPVSTQGIDVHSLTAGIYVVKITLTNGTLSTHKVVVNK